MRVVQLHNQRAQRQMSASRLRGRNCVRGAGRGLNTPQERKRSTNHVFEFWLKVVDSRCRRIDDDREPDPLSGHLFLFRNRRGDRLKILAWDRSGFWILHNVRPGVRRLQFPSARVSSCPGAGPRYTNRPQPDDVPSERS
jgi:IS66 Orf2 like protein